ncbi:MAG: phosphotransferase system enzyme I (PtsP) [bacterium]|jgi:phosphotransferase system enzyme I (PtsP)
MDKSSTEQSPQLSILKEISNILTRSHDHQEILNNVVTLVSRRFQTQVCSLYLLDDSGKTLSLKASVGLNQTSVENITMSLDEGLTGLVFTSGKPVSEKYASKHPKFKFFPKSGEEKYSSFLGVPLIARRKPIGVLVIQTVQPRGFQADDISALVTIASQLSGVVQNAELLFYIQQKKQETQALKAELIAAQHQINNFSYPDEINDDDVVQEYSEHENDIKKDQIITGISASPGIGIGNAVILEDNISFDFITESLIDNVLEEKKRFIGALDKSIEQVSEIKKRVTETLSEEDSAIFHAHLMILEDGALNKKISELIQKNFSAEWALKLVINQYVDAYSKIQDPYLRERATDVLDIGHRILGNLLGVKSIAETTALEKKSIIIADDITPSQMVTLDLDKVSGFVIAGGGKTSHCSILAKSFNIPAVVGLGSQIRKIKKKDLIILDGHEAIVLVNPNLQVKGEYQNLLEQHLIYQSELELLKNFPSITKNKEEFFLFSNVGLKKDIELSNRYGAAGIGLYRSEFYFFSKSYLPTEEEQTEMYSYVLKQMKGKPTTIRTLDLGGDKFLPYLQVPKEQNPFLGWRSIRISLGMLGMFRSQLRALLRASVHGNLSILFPMISGMQELRQALSLIQEEKENLLREGYQVDPNISLGIMIEVPSAARLASKLIQEVDFFSIGTNDLTQYTLAVDRNNQKVANLYDSLHPAVLYQIADVVKAANDANKPVSICGEMASDIQAILPLAGLGIRRLSLNPSHIPIAKEVIRKINTDDVKKLTADLIEMDTPQEIRNSIQIYLDHLNKK